MKDRDGVVSVGFYLTVFERKVGVPHHLEDVYRLREISDLIRCHEIESYKIEEALMLAKVLDIERISASNVHSRNVVICISGFLT